MGLATECFFLHSVFLPYACHFILYDHFGTHYPPLDAFLLSLCEFRCFELGFQTSFYLNYLNF